MAGRLLPPVGFGSMLLAMEGRPARDEALRVLHAAFDAGVRLVDTAVNYCLDEHELGYDEALVAEALATWSGDSDEVLVVGKGGNLRTREQPFVQDASPENLRRSCETTLRALGVEAVGLYLLHAVDPQVPLVESMGALAELQQQGKVQHVGISNAGRRALAEAQGVVEVAAVQNGLSPWSTSSLPVLRACEEQGIAFLAYSPLGSKARAAALGERPGFARVAADRGVSPQRVALAWLLALSPVLVALPSARRAASIVDSAAAADLRLSEEELAVLAADVQPAGR